MIAASGCAKLAFDIAGAEHAADVLLIHAGVADRRSWAHVVERLAPEHRCVAFDMRGFGETTYEREDGWSQVADALAVLDAAGLSRPILVACSIGGEIAIDLALAYPQRIAALVLIGTAVRGAPCPQSSKPGVQPNCRLCLKRQKRRETSTVWRRGCGSMVPPRRKDASRGARGSCFST
jgi:pimeloyl-ACP methyl ester carboxylesterase